MLRSLYIGTTGMITQRKTMDVIVNNIVNSDTVGYKKDTVITRSFQDMLIDRVNDTAAGNPGGNRVGPLNTGIYADQVVTSFAQGSLEATGGTTDFALSGEGFFEVSTAGGKAYTRSGNFTLDSERNLVTPEGHYVMSKEGNRINIKEDGFTLAPDGSIKDSKGAQIARLSLVKPENEAGLRKRGDNLYANVSAGEMTQVTAPVVKQGFLESSNVDIGREITEMLMTNRIYESSQRVVKMVDESLSKTVNDLGRF